MALSWRACDGTTQACVCRAQHGEDLAKYYAAADVLVFPSRTDTFGLVILESLASGVPVAAHRVTGPLDAIGNAGVGVLDDDLALAIRRAVTISPEKCRSHARKFTWESVALQFLDNLQPLPGRSIAPLLLRAA